MPRPGRMTTESAKMVLQAKLNTRLAPSPLPCPRRMAICTEEPTAIMSDNAKLTIIRGITRFTAASASEPMNRPTNTPSAMVYSEVTPMLTMLGSAHLKNSFVGESMPNMRSCCCGASIVISSS